MKVILYDLGQFAEYAAYAITHDSDFELGGFCIEKAFRPPGTDDYMGLPVLDFEDVGVHCPPDDYQMFIAVGDNEVRERIFRQAKAKGYTLSSYISSRATYWENLEYGENVFISEDSGLQPFVSLGDNTIIIGAKIGHHGTIGSHSLLSCCYLAGNVKVGDHCFLGMNACVKQNLSIGENNIIGMGCIIERSTEPNAIFHNQKVTQKRNISADRFRSRYLR